MMRKALVIGIDEYADYPLSGCVNDAYAMKSVLETNADGSPNFAVRIITDPQVSTKSNLKKQINELFETETDVALLYFAGHGMVTSTGGFITTVDAEPYDEGIPMNEILNIASKSRAVYKIIILDCCYSGKMGNLSCNENVSQLCKEMNIIAASRDYEGAEEGEDGHGVFTSLLVDALQGGAADVRGHITPGSVYAYIDSALGPWDQRPVFKANVSRFVSIRDIPPKIPLETLRKITDYFSEPQKEILLDPSYEYTSDKANSENVKILKDLQKYESEGLVKPVGTPHLYWAAMESNSCKLTALGFHYWRLVKKNML